MRYTLLSSAVLYSLSCSILASATNSQERQPAGGAPIILSVNPAPPQAVEKSGLKFSAFFDARLTHISSERSSRVTNSENGFMIEDGALYFAYEKEALSLFLDLPFSRLTNLTDTDGDTVTDTPSSDNADFGFAAGKAQAYARYKIHDSWSFVFGQFDTVYGVELNDSKDRFFGRTGLVYNQALPVTHTGAMIEWNLFGAYVKALMANPNNKGSLGHDTSGNDEANFEYGAVAGYANENMRGQLGYLSRKKNDVTGKSSDRTLIDAILGTTLGAFSLDLEYAIVGDPAKNTLTATATDQEDDGTGLFALATYKINDTMNLGLRYEIMDHDPDASGDIEESSLGASAHYRLSENLEVRGEYIGYVAKANAAANDDNTDRFAIGGVFNF